MPANPLSAIKSKSVLARSMLSAEPSYMVLFATAVCNARCPMCFYWEEIESANAKQELRLDEYEKITESLNHLYYLSIGGGEPFIRKDLSRVVELFYRNSNTRAVTVATNGWFEKRVREYVEYLSRHCPGIQLRIQVSIDNLFEKHDQNRLLKGLFNKLLDTCKTIEELKKAGAPLMFSIGTVLTPENRDDLAALRRFLDENIAYDDLSLIYPRGNAKDAHFKAVSLEEYRAAKKDFNSVKAEPGTFARLYRAVDRHAKDQLEGYLEKGPEGYPWTCVAGDKMITLTEKGLLSPCEMLYQLQPEIDSDLGNVRDHNYDIPAMLAREKARNLRKYIEDTHCSCSYECAALCNVVFHKKEWPNVLMKFFKV
ncbi:MAG: radical SAM protein [Calditrichaeota bacterium]|nr:radical SAM protein [Calditrichota bacterium]